MIFNYYPCGIAGKGTQRGMIFCDARTVPESQIEQVLVAAINKAWCGKDTFLATLQKNIEAVLESEKGQPLTDIDKRLAELQEELLKRTGARAD